MPEGYLDCKVIINVGQEGPGSRAAGGTTIRDASVRVAFSRIVTRARTIIVSRRGDIAVICNSGPVLDAIQIEPLVIVITFGTTNLGVDFGVEGNCVCGGDFGVEGNCICSKGKENDGNGSLGKHDLFKLIILIISLIRAFQVNENNPIKVTEIDALNSKDRVF